MQNEESNTLVKLAKAVIEHAPEGCDAFWDIKFSDIEAALSTAEPVGWQLVPTEPTDDMIEAFRQAHARKCVDIASHTPTEHPEDGGGPIGYGYRAMLHAAPAKQD